MTNSWMMLLTIMLVIALSVVAVLLGRHKAAATRGLDTFRKRPLLNKIETKLARVLDTYARSNELRLMVQVSYGEFLSSPDRASYMRINSKRADFVLVDTGFDVVAVIELTGGGHFGRSTMSREQALASDLVKSQAVRSAGIAFVLIYEGFTQLKVIEDLDQALGKLGV